MLVPNVTWIIAEDSHTYTKLVTNVLSSCQVRGGEGREGGGERERVLGREGGREGGGERERVIMKVKIMIIIMMN